LPPRLRALSIACLVDHRVARDVAAGRATSTNARYDLSVVEALRRLYREVHLVRAFPDFPRTLEELRRLRPDVMFNLAFSASCFEVPFVAELHRLGIPFTGSGSAAIELANDKVRSRILLREAGVRVPRFVVLDRGSRAAIDFDPPYIVKPATLAASAGIHADSVVNTRAEARRLASRIWRRFEPTAVCDAFIIGRELRVAVIEDGRGTPRVAGISEWRFPEGDGGWGFKTEAIRTNLRVRKARQVTRGIVTLAPAMARDLRRIVRDSLHILGVKGYATVDIRIDAEEQLHVLEVNANPGLWGGGSVWSRPSFDVNIRRVVDAALRG
jgi:D-alanine-D-alanine ligase